MQPGKRGLNKSVNVTRNLKNTAPILMTGLHMAHLLGYKWLITGHNLGVYERYSPYVIHTHFLRIIAKLDTILILTFVLKRQDKCGSFCLTIVQSWSNDWWLCIHRKVGMPGVEAHRMLGGFSTPDPLGQSTWNVGAVMFRLTTTSVKDFPAPPCLRVKSHVFFLSFP